MNAALPKTRMVRRNCRVVGWWSLVRVLVVHAAASGGGQWAAGGYARCRCGRGHVDQTPSSIRSNCSLRDPGARRAAPDAGTAALRKLKLSCHRCRSGMQRWGGFARRLVARGTTRSSLEPREDRRYPAGHAASRRARAARCHRGKGESSSQRRMRTATTRRWRSLPVPMRRGSGRP